MTDISVENYSLSAGSKKLLINTKLVVSMNIRYGLVGPNGCGKSTLLNDINKHESLHKYLLNAGTERQPDYPDYIVSFSARTSDIALTIKNIFVELVLKSQLQYKYLPQKTKPLSLTY